MYKIGEFSQLTGLSSKTLRYYDEINLLKPSKIDNFTNYRYYDENELFLFKKIEYLKKLGFTLEEIKNNINNISVEFLENKRNELVNKQQYINEQIDEIDRFIKSIKDTKVKKLNK